MSDFNVVHPSIIMFREFGTVPCKQAGTTPGILAGVQDSALCGVSPVIPSQMINLIGPWNV